MTSVVTSDDVLTVETVEDLQRAFISDTPTGLFVINVTTADTDGKHARVEASYTVMLIRSVASSKTGLAIQGENYKVRRAFIEGHAADYYLENGRGHLALSGDLKLALCYDHDPGVMPRRIDRVAIHRVVSVAPASFEIGNIA